MNVAWNGAPRTIAAAAEALRRFEPSTLAYWSLRCGFAGPYRSKESSRRSFIQSWEMRMRTGGGCDRPPSLEADEEERASSALCAATASPHCRLLGSECALVVSDCTTRRLRSRRRLRSGVDRDPCL